MIGSLLVAITKPSPSTRAWGTGARGEQRLGALLDALPQTWVLHDRAIPGSRANIDHIVVASSGVWVIDTKNYRGKVERRGGGLLSASNAQLFVNGRNRTPLTRGVTVQVAAVRTPLASDIRVEGVLCFLGGDWPTGGCPFRVEGVHVHGPRSLKAAISRSGPLGIRDREVIAASLSRTFPPAG